MKSESVYIQFETKPSIRRMLKCLAVYRGTSMSGVLRALVVGAFNRLPDEAKELDN